MSCHVQQLLCVLVFGFYGQTHKESGQTKGLSLGVTRNKYDGKVWVNNVNSRQVSMFNQNLTFKV